MTKSRLIKWKTNWLIEEKMGQETHIATRNYYFDGQLCGRVELTDGLAKQFGGYKLIEKDIRNIISWLNHIEILLKPYDTKENPQEECLISTDRDTFQVIKGLFVASVTFYGKLFTKANGRKVKLESAWLTTDDLLLFHEELMLLRHTYTAHSGEDSAEISNTVLAVDPIRLRQTPPELFCELTQPDSIGVKDIAIFKKLLDELHDKVNNKINELGQLILQKEVSEKGIDHLYSKIKGTPNKHIE